MADSALPMRVVSAVMSEARAVSAVALAVCSVVMAPSADPMRAVRAVTLEAIASSAVTRASRST
ncbi:hypothetical protein D9M68_970710 [compost metagenome]